MEIKLSQFYLNKTRKYLFPVLKFYGPEYRDKILQLNKLAVGIGDFVLDKCEKKLNRHIYILVDTRTTKNFLYLLNYFQKHPSYGFDYPFDNIQTGNLHLIALQIPKSLFDSFNLFVESKYSKMYTDSQINILFNPITIYKDSIRVLKKDLSYQEEFIKQVAERYNMSVTDIILTENDEFDFPIEEFQEVFNNHLKKHE